MSKNIFEDTQNLNIRIENYKTKLQDQEVIMEKILIAMSEGEISASEINFELEKKVSLSQTLESLSRLLGGR